MNRAGPKHVVAAAVTSAAAVGVFAAMGNADITDLPTLKAYLLDHCPDCYSVSSYLYNTLLDSELWSPYFGIALGATLLIERLLPAVPTQPLISVGFWQDAMWFLIYVFFIFALLDGYQSLLTSGFNRYLGFLRVDAISRWPVPLQIVTVILISDFVAWFHHLARHKVPWFWHFHTIHHSQKQMNLFTDLRNHPVDTLIASTIRFLPLASLTSHAVYPTAAGWIFLTRWYTHFYHANVRLNYGPLRYILVTPQSHRIHHSADAKHRDRNFGVIFSIWDCIFRTQYHNGNEYPMTGVDDHQFPMQSGPGISAMFITFVRQLIFPFLRIHQSVRPVVSPALRGRPSSRGEID